MDPACLATKTPLAGSIFGPKDFLGSPEIHKYSPFPLVFTSCPPQNSGASPYLQQHLRTTHQFVEPTTCTMLGIGKNDRPATGIESGSDTQNDQVEENLKSRWERLWPVMACGAGLFSDGYINNVCTLP